MVIYIAICTVPEIITKVNLERKVMKVMKVICTNGTINLNNFDKVSYRESLLGSEQGYPVEARKTVASGSLLGGVQTITEEIARLTNEYHAKRLVEDITKAWVNGKKVFDVNKWIES